MAIACQHALFASLFKEWKSDIVRCTYKKPDSNTDKYKNTHSKKNGKHSKNGHRSVWNGQKWPFACEDHHVALIL